MSDTLTEVTEADIVEVVSNAQAEIGRRHEWAWKETRVIVAMHERLEKAEQDTRLLDAIANCPFGLRLIDGKASRNTPFDIRGEIRKALGNT